MLLLANRALDLRYIVAEDDPCWQEGPAYTEAFLTVLRQVSKEEVVQYILALLDDMITGAILLVGWDALHCGQLH